MRLCQRSLLPDHSLRVAKLEREAAPVLKNGSVLTRSAESWEGCTGRGVGAQRPVITGRIARAERERSLFAVERSSSVHAFSKTRQPEC